MARIFWLNRARLAIEEAFADGRRVVIDDVRFENEAALIASLGGVVIRIHGRPGSATPGSGAHVSELQAFYTRWQVLNDGPVEILAARLDGLLGRMGEAGRAG